MSTVREKPMATKQETALAALKQAHADEIEITRIPVECVLFNLEHSLVFRLQFPENYCALDR